MIPSFDVDTALSDDAETARAFDGFLALTLNLFVDGAGAKSLLSCASFLTAVLVDLVTFLNDEDFSVFLFVKVVGLRILLFSIIVLDTQMMKKKRSKSTYVYL